MKSVEISIPPQNSPFEQVSCLKKSISNIAVGLGNEVHRSLAYKVLKSGMPAEVESPAPQRMWGLSEWCETKFEPATGVAAWATHCGGFGNLALQPLQIVSP